MDSLDAAQSRRSLLRNVLAIGAGAVVSGCASRVTRTAGLAPIVPVPQATIVPQPVVPVPPAPVKPTAPAGIRPELFQRALAALEKHKGAIPHRDRIAIADFSKPSSQARFYFVDLEKNTSRSLLVAHGIGSDPSHTGYLQRFSNEIESNATCEGAFLAADYYVGKHNLSQRLIGLDNTNYNALTRAIVVHSAWYANPDMIAAHGKLGRSQGCFAVGEALLEDVFNHLGQGRMIYAAKV